MRRSAQLLLLLAAAAAMSACGEETIGVPRSSPLYAGAVLFSQRCSGCHTFSYAGTHGSAANVRSAQANNGPDFDIRCERPVARVLYAIENGGFSGAYMPQNVVVGQQAIEVAKFVANYSGSKAPKIPGTQTCKQKPIGTIPSFTTVAATTPASTTSSATATTPTTAPRPSKHKRAKKKP